MTLISHSCPGIFCWESLTIARPAYQGIFSPCVSRGQGLDGILTASSIRASASARRPHCLRSYRECRWRARHPAGSDKFLSYLGAAPLPRISKCNEGPVVPNVFTDGSYLHPGQCLALASFGSWQPNWLMNEVTEEDSDFCRAVQCDDGNSLPGINMAGTIPGVFSSSTRAELAGVTAAMAIPGPIHLARDNLSVVDGINDLLVGNKRSRRPWALRSDGDL
jgi:hypothetical protein